jgi:hypothetical protein
MGLSDKFKNLAKQAQDAVAEHADKLHDAVDTVGVAVNEKTQGKYASKIAKVGDKTGDAIDKFGGAEQQQPDAATDPAPSSSAKDEAEASTPAEAMPHESESAESEASQPAPSAATAPPPPDGFPSFDD